MSTKPVRPREAARRDVEAAVDYYAREAGADVAIGFIDALQVAYRFIGDLLPADRPGMPTSLAFPGCAAAS